MAALIHDASSAENCIKLMLKISFPDTGCQKLIEVSMYFLWEAHATEEAAEALSGVEGTAVPAGVGTTNKVSPWSRCLRHGWVCLLSRKWHLFYWPKRTGEQKCKSVQGVIVDETQSVLNWVAFLKRREGCSWTDRHCCSLQLGPKQASRIQRLSVSLKKIICTNMLSEIP